MKIDAKSVTGKRLQIAEQAEVLVIGAGPAGCAAAKAARANGAQVVLVDEHPVPAKDMGEHVPQIWGERMGAEVNNRAAMMEQMLAARPELADLFEIGVDLRLGTACWGLFANQPNMGWMPGLIAGLIDADTGNRLVQCDQIIVATGQRDMGLAFPGWDTPGVMGLHAALTLKRLYNAFSGTSVTLIGATDDAVSGALLLQASGVRVAGIVERAETLPCDPAIERRARDAGIPFFLSDVPRSVLTDKGEVSGVRLRDRSLTCDSVLMAVGAVPMIDLLHSAGAHCAFQPERGGFVPVLSDTLETSIPGLRAVGDCAGLWSAKSADPEIATAEGTAAALAALGQPHGTLAPVPAAGQDIGAYRKAWVRETVVAALDEMPVCLCEDVTARDILEVRPPAYLDTPPRANTRQTLADLLDAGPPDPDQVKRLTRAGMGPCQGRRCREQVQALLALQDDLSLGQVPLAGYRVPIRPLALADAVLPEDLAVTQNWDPWMGIPLQWAPYWHIGATYTVATLNPDEDYVNE